MKIVIRNVNSLQMRTPRKLEPGRWAGEGSNPSDHAALIVELAR